MGKRKGKEHEDRNRESVRKKESQCKKKHSKNPQETKARICSHASMGLGNWMNVPLHS